MPKSKQTFEKKDKEKRRIKEREEKRQRMAERKANKPQTTSLSDMMAYMDEDGNLTSTPQNPQIKKVYAAEEIPSGVPKQEERDRALRTGTVIFFDKAKGFGFINDLAKNERIFFHINNLEDNVNESDKVMYKVESGPRGPNAIQVKKAV